MGRLFHVEYRGAIFHITNWGKLNPFGVNEHQIQGKRNRSSTKSNVIMYLFQGNRGVGSEEVGRLFGGIRYSAVR
jgi:hypothetical protein